VPFLRTWFANNHVDAFTISLWYKRLGGVDATNGALVNNGDSVDDAGFSLRVAGNDILSKIRTETGQDSLAVNIPVAVSGWHHVAYVYDGGRLTTYVDSAVGHTTMSGYLVNNDVPMNVGFEDNTYFFEGMMDELRVYTRALTAAEVAAL
ncbi:hypothetical protein LSAT2_011959, partial [Lamellibrachia satsuma]